MLYRTTVGTALLAPDSAPGGTLIADTTSDGSGVNPEIASPEGDDSISTSFTPADPSAVFDAEDTPVSSRAAKSPVVQPKIKNAQNPDQNKPLDKTEEPEKPEDDTEPTPESIEPELKNLPKKRDYSKYSPELTQVLKSLPNREFKLVTEQVLPKLIEAEAKAKNLETETANLKDQLAGKKLPPSWYEHPDAYELAPEYRQLTQQFSLAHGESQFYRAQLLKIKRGESFQTITGYDQSGKPTLSAAYEASPENEVEISSMLQQLEQHKLGITNQADQLRKTFSREYSSAGETLERAGENHFKALLPELQPKQQEIETFLGSLPSVYKSHPVAKLAAKMFSVIINQGKMISGYQTKKTTAAQTQADAKKAGPKPTTPGKTGKPKDTDEIDFSTLKESFSGES